MIKHSINLDIIMSVGRFDNTLFLRSVPLPGVENNGGSA